MRLIDASAVACVIASCGLLQGCAINMDHGVQVSDAQASAFTVGTTTPADVIQALGKPRRSAVLPNGQTLYFDAHSQTRVNPPSLGTLTGTSPRSERVSSDFTSFIFDTDLKLVSVSRSVRPPPRPAESH